LTESVERIFEKAGAVLKGHFLLTSGLHSPVYWEKSRVIQYPVYTEKLCRMIADHYRKAGAKVVAGPTTPGIILAYEVARQLGVRGIFAEREEPGSVRATGGSISEVVAAVKKLGGEIVGIGVLVDRSVAKIDFGFPFFACHRVEEVTYQPQQCPLCAAGIPLVKPGSSQTYK
jgi:orotate phosphoribosyltransferase